MIHIPYAALRDSCYIRIYREKGIFGERQLLCESRLERVRLEPEKRSGAEKSYGGGTLYYDCARSLPEDAELFRDGCVSVVEFRGAFYRVTGIKYIYCGSALHHIEMKLGGTA